MYMCAYVLNLIVTVVLRCGECKIGVGSSGGPLGTFLFANLAGSSGSTCAQRRQLKLKTNHQRSNNKTTQERKTNESPESHLFFNHANDALLLSPHATRSVWVGSVGDEFCLFALRSHWQATHSGQHKIQFEMLKTSQGLLPST
jgi:hypothetical protein